jgi:translation initiation factor 1A
MLFAMTSPLSISLCHHSPSFLASPNSRIDENNFYIYKCHFLADVTFLSLHECALCTAAGKGGKNRRRGKGDGEESKRELEFKEDGQEYAQVVRMLGNGRCECFCYDGVTRLGHIRGKMRKKVWVTAGDIVLVGKRDFQDEKVDILHKYSADEARNLKQYGELPETARINETAVDQAMAGDGDDDDIGIDFDDI